MELKTELIEELNNLIDSLSPTQANMFKKLTVIELVDLKQAIENKFNKMQEAIKIGGVLSNVAYNLGQSSNTNILSEHDKKIMFDLSKKWDTAIKEI